MVNKTSGKALRAKESALRETEIRKLAIKVRRQHLWYNNLPRSPRTLQRWATRTDLREYLRIRGYQV